MTNSIGVPVGLRDAAVLPGDSRIGGIYSPDPRLAPAGGYRSGQHVTQGVSDRNVQHTGMGWGYPPAGTPFPSSARCTDVRSRTARALGRIGDLRARLALMRALKDREPEVRRAAREALGVMKGR